MTKFFLLVRPHAVTTRQPCTVRCCLVIVLPLRSEFSNVLRVSYYQGSPVLLLVSEQVYSSLNFSKFQREQRETRARAAGRRCPTGFELIPDAYSQALSVSKFTSAPSETIGPIQVFLPKTGVVEKPLVLIKIPLNKLNTRFEGLGHIFTSITPSLLPKLRV